MAHGEVAADVMEHEVDAAIVHGEQFQQQGSLYDIIDGAIYDAELLRLAEAETLSAASGILTLAAAKRIWAAVDEEGVSAQMWEVSLRTVSYIVRQRKLDITAKTFLQEAVKASMKYWRDREKLDAKMTSSKRATLAQPATPLKRIRPQRSMLELTGIESEISEATTPTQINAAMRKINKWMEGHGASSSVSPPKQAKKQPKNRVRLVDGEKYNADLLDIVEAKVQQQGQDRPIDLRTVKQLASRARVDGVVPPISRRSLEYISEEYELNDAASDYIDSLVHDAGKRTNARSKAKLTSNSQKSENGTSEGTADLSRQPCSLARRRLSYKQPANGFFPQARIRKGLSRTRLTTGRRRLCFKQAAHAPAADALVAARAFLQSATS